MKKSLLVTASFLFLTLYPAQSEPELFHDYLRPIDSELQKQIIKIDKADSRLEEIINELRLKQSEDESNQDTKIDLASFLLKQVYLKRHSPYDENEELLLEAYSLLQDNYYLEIIWGDLFFLADDYENAISHYESALSLNQNDINAFGICGWAYYNALNYEEAIKKFDIYLNKYPNDYKIIFFVANSYFKLEDYEQTVERCEKALESCSDNSSKKDIENLLRQAKEKLASTEGFSQDEDSRFVLTFAGNSKEDIGDVTIEMLNDIYDEVTKALNCNPDVKINVKFYLTNDYYENKTPWSWSAAQASGITVEVPLKNGYKDENYVKGLLAHEFTHTIINLKTKGYHAPTWVHEGLAQYLEYSTRYGSPETLRSDFESIFQNDFIENDLYIPLNKIPSYMRSSGDKDVSRAYVASYIAIRCMSDNYGEQSFDKLLTSLGEGKGIEQAVKDATGQDYSVFQDEIKQWIKNQ